MHGKISLKLINNALAIIVIGLACFIFIWPFLADITWWFKHSAPVISHSTGSTIPVNEPIPAENTLVVPRLAMRQVVYDGAGEPTLTKGIWHIPTSSSPPKGGNTIFAGHRFSYSSYTAGGVFYHLDKLATGDKMYLYWDGKKYTYEITGIHEVQPTDATLVAQTDEPILTLYTCTPLWSAKNRLVVTAKLMEQH